MTQHGTIKKTLNLFKIYAVSYQLWTVELKQLNPHFTFSFKTVILIVYYTKNNLNWVHLDSIYLIQVGHF